MGLFRKPTEQEQRINKLSEFLKKADTEINLINLKIESLYISIEDLQRIKKDIEDIKASFNIVDLSNQTPDDTS